MTESPTREELVALCEEAVAPVASWHDRDSASATEQLGKAWALLKAGCDFNLTRGAYCVSDESTWWVDIWWPGFSAFEYGRDDHDAWEHETFYIPTRKRVDEAAGRDWY